MEIKIEGSGDIYLVDDDEMFYFIFMRFFEKNSTVENKIVYFNSAQSCLDRVVEIQDCQSQYPSLILMDINMPGMNGFECVQRIRENEKYIIQPVILMLSSSNSAVDVNKALESGASDYIEKPANLDELVFVAA